MDRLSPQDASFLYVENELNHMAIAALGIFEGPPPAQDEIEEMVAAKLDLVPRYRQRVRFVPFEIGRPVWADDPHFLLRYHVRHSALPAPGSEEQLRTLVGRVMSQQLDRTKPLSGNSVGFARPISSNPIRWSASRRRRMSSACSACRSQKALMAPGPSSATRSRHSATSRASKVEPSPPASTGSLEACSSVIECALQRCTSLPLGALV